MEKHPFVADAGGAGTVHQAPFQVTQQAFGTELFTGLGIDLTTCRGIVVKSSQHFHAAFAPLASEVLYVESPGLLNTDFANVAYRHRSLDYWPRVERVG